MAVRGERHPGSEIDAHLDDLASRDAQIVPLQLGALDSRLLRLRRVQHQAASDDYNRQYAFALHHRRLLAHKLNWTQCYKLTVEDFITLLSN
jgi:hypothetical protein